QVTNGKLGCPSQRRSHDGHFPCWHLPGSPSNKRRILCACCIRTLNTLTYSHSPSLTLPCYVHLKVRMLVVSLTCSRPALQGRGLQVQGKNGPRLAVSVVGISPTLMLMTLLPLAWQAPYFFPTKRNDGQRWKLSKRHPRLLWCDLGFHVLSTLVSCLRCIASLCIPHASFLTQHLNRPTTISILTFGVSHTLSTPRSLHCLGKGRTRFRIIRNKHRNLQ
ncbi:hypothetical protein CCUS01_09390, partial [Colletotrichum cuscutae]